MSSSLSLPTPLFLFYFFHTLFSYAGDGHFFRVLDGIVDRYYADKIHKYSSSEYSLLDDFPSDDVASLLNLFSQAVNMSCEG